MQPEMVALGIPPGPPTPGGAKTTKKITSGLPASPHKVPLKRAPFLRQFFILPKQNSIFLMLN